MSAAVRQAIVDALAPISGVKGYPYFRPTVTPGDAVVRLDRTDYPQPSDWGGLQTWQVLVILPVELEAAERWVDDKRPALVAALADVMQVVSAVPTELRLPEGLAVPCLIIEGKRESE